MPTLLDVTHSHATSVTTWLNLVCPFSWNTARWLDSVETSLSFEIDWQGTSLAIPNEGRELHPPQKARMADSRRIGRLMAMIRREKEPAGLAADCLTFGKRCFDNTPGVSTTWPGKCRTPSSSFTQLQRPRPAHD